MWLRDTMVRAFWLRDTGMSALAFQLAPEEVVRQYHELMRDRKYRGYPLGEDVGRFLRALRVERRSENTRSSYETVLRRFVLDHLEVDHLSRFCEPGGYDLIVDFLYRWWGDSHGDTIGQRAAVVRSFFNWAKRSGRVPFNPAEELKVPRGSRKLREAHALDEIRLIAGAQPRIGDEAGVLVGGRLGLRKMELGRIQARDVNLAQDVIYIRAAKGNKPVEQAIQYEDVRQALSLWLTQAEPTDYLVAPLRGPMRPLDRASIHRWFARCCERAGVDPFPLHELRHSAGDFLWRETGNLYAAKMLLRHASVKTTEDYLHPTADDLRSQMKAADK